VLHYPNQDDPKGPPNVAATSAAITSALAPGPYYWNVVPVDAEGNRGVATQTSAFSWLWNSVNAATMTDLDPAPEAFDLRFSCNPIPGAARYEVEINSSVDFAPGSKVCCTAAEADDLYRCARRSAASSSSPRRRPATSPRTGS